MNEAIKINRCKMPIRVFFSCWLMIFLSLLIALLSACTDGHDKDKMIGVYWLVATDSRSGLTFYYFSDTNTVIEYRIYAGTGKLETFNYHPDVVIPNSWSLISNDSIEIRGWSYKIISITDSIMILQFNDKMKIMYVVADPHEYANKLLNHIIRPPR